MTTTPKQVKATLNRTLEKDLDSLCAHLGLCPSSTVKLAIRRLAQSELQQNQTASSAIVTKEAV